MWRALNPLRPKCRSHSAEDTGITTNLACTIRQQCCSCCPHQWSGSKPVTPGLGKSSVSYFLISFSTRSFSGSTSTDAGVVDVEAPSWVGDWNQSNGLTVTFIFSAGGKSDASDVADLLVTTSALNLRHITDIRFLGEMPKGHQLHKLSTEYVTCDLMLLSNWWVTGYHALTHDPSTHCLLWCILDNVSGSSLPEIQRVATDLPILNNYPSCCWEGADRMALSGKTGQYADDCYSKRGNLGGSLVHGIF